ncbi:hypothetical protein E3N88_03570 [Mikania micrantha]|uniref:Uncharacterized protein n=1 Tax=Mikania micrantha TaxID=192012 RepID=A0A5N6Q6V0_9ASTR|nr:hypothetical protein E3N88_03570 [Mikania micrantha]
MEIRVTTRLDAQEHQSDAEEIKITLQSLEGDRIESVAFRKAVLAWITHQEKQKVDRSYGSRDSSGIFGSSGLPPTPPEPPLTLPWAVNKVKLPEFQSELLQRFGSFEIPHPSEQFVPIQQSELISDLIEDVADTGCPNSVASKAAPHFCYSIGSGLITDDGPQVLGQGKPKSVNTPNLTERGFPACSDNIHSVPFTTPSSIPMEEGNLRNFLLGDDEIVNGEGNKNGLDATPSISVLIHHCWI